MMIHELALADRVGGLKPSATVEMSERIRAAKAAGQRVLGLASGDPNLVTDPRIIAAAERALHNGDTHYATSAGLPALREALARREEAASASTVDPDDVLVTPGGKFAVLTALMACIEPGAEVLVPDPGWVSYSPCVRLCGGTPVLVPCLEGYQEEVLKAVVTPRTRAIIVNSPANPSARVVPREELELLARLAERHNLWLIFDQVYADLAYGEAVPRLQSIPGVRSRLFIADSLSKTFGMTGWRVGVLITPPGLAKLVNRFIQHSIYCVPPFVQAAAVEALRLADEIVPGYIELFRRRLALAAPRLNAVPGIACSMPEATFYLFPAVDGDDKIVAERWLSEGEVAVMPGSAFGSAGGGHLRLSLTCSDDVLEEALQRIESIGIPGRGNTASAQ